MGLGKEFEKELNRLWQEYSYLNYDRLQTVATLTVEEFKEVASHFVNWQKQQMIKDAMDAEVISGSVCVKKETMNKTLERLHLKAGDKVKELIIKED